MIEIKDDKTGSEGQNILNEGKKELKNVLTGDKGLIARFYTSIGRNGGVIFLIRSYFIKDEEESLSRMEKKELLSVESLKGFTYDEIFVQKIDVISNKGYVTINDSINIPLVNLEESRSSKYFFDRNDTIKEIKRCNEIEYNVAKKINEVSEKAVSFIKRIIEKEQQ
jgi:hypothetical protein